jgi:adenine-specific DNA-methyltransferase
VHSYLSYLEQRLLLAHDLLCNTGSLFVQIGDENAHRVRSLADGVFGSLSFVAQIAFQTGAALK